MKILIIDAFPDTHLQTFKELGLTVDYQPQLKAAEVARAMDGVGVLVARSTEVRAEVIERGAALGLIVRAGAGTNTIDVKAASARGVYVANCPGKNSIAVAELTWGLLIALDRRLPDQVADLRRGAWNKKEYSQAKGLYGRTLGIIGLGSIGVEVARRAQAFGMRLIGWSRSLTDARAQELGLERMKTVPELCGRADAVTIHVALTPETRGLIGEAALARLRPGALLVNTARAEVVDGAALGRAISASQLRVATDVFDREPASATASFDDSLGMNRAVYGTHHVGASTEQAQSAVADETVRIVRLYLEEGTVPNCVNLAERSPATFQLLVRHLDQVGVLAEVLGAIRRHQLNVEEVENTIFAGARAAIAKIRLCARPPAELLEEVRARPEIIHLELVELGG